MQTILSIVGVASILTLAASVVWVARVFSQKIGPSEGSESVEAPPEPYDDAWIHVRLTELSLAVAEGIQHVDRSERRVRAVVASAKKRFESEGYTDPGLEAEEEGFRYVDVGNSKGEPVPPVPETVDTPQFDFAGIIPGRLT